VYLTHVTTQPGIPTPSEWAEPIHTSHSEALARTGQGPMSVASICDWVEDELVRSCRSTGDCVELPASRHPLQHVLTTVIELDTRANYEILDGARDKDFARGSQRTDSSGDVNGEAAQIVAPHLAFTGVETQAQLDIEGSGGVDDPLATTDGSSWTIEGSDEAVSRRVDLPTPEDPKLFADNVIMAIQQGPPPLITQRSCTFG
jgi:hypothetical protein